MKYIFVFLLFTNISCRSNSQNVQSKAASNQSGSVELSNDTSADSLHLDLSRVTKSEKEWKSQLSEQEYYVLREKGTERAFTGDLLKIKKSGIYTCAACQLPLFSSDTKFDSGTGWPSYYQPIKSEVILEDTDYVLGYARTEVMCARCGGHLGHVFSDGPKPTGLRYCINSVSMDFVEEGN